MKALLFALCIFAIRLSAAARDTAIVPGHSIGSIHVGDDRRLVEQRYGSTTFQDAAMGRTWEMWRFKGGGSLEVYCHRSDGYIARVEQIRTTSRRYFTSAGLRAGSSLAGVRRVYPALQLVPDEDYHPETHHPRLAVYDSMATGIAFEFQRDTCTAIIVHLPKAKATIDIIGGYFADETR
jgi:hypothetical protein